MRIRAALIAMSAALFVSVSVGASGPLGVYGIIEKVVFEPDDAHPERIQLWGAFAYVVECCGNSSSDVSKAERGYLYFRLPDVNSSPTGLADLVRREWADLKAVAGTGQAVGFGSWQYIGAFSALEPGKRSNTPPYILERTPAGGNQTDLHVRSAAEKPASPAPYQTSGGVVKISANGNRADIVKQLQDALRK